jgi:putative acetyltransferase
MPVANHWRQASHAQDVSMETIRPEQPEDAAAVRQVHQAAFPTATEADLVERLRAGGKSAVSLVAVDAGQVVGHIIFSPVTFDPPVAVTGFGLAPMAVLADHWKHGVGRRLVQNGLAECHARGACLVVVVGEPDYYRRFGFESASRHGLRNEFGAEDTFMVYVLDAGQHPPPGTVVKYAPEFDKFKK